MKRKFNFLAIALALAASASACSHREIQAAAPTAPPQDGTVWARIEWIKDKGKKFDLELTLGNLSKQPVLVYLADMTCFKGTVQGDLKHTFFNTGHRTFKFHPGQQGHYKMVCKLGESATGDYRVRISRALDNPGGDGITAGQPVSQNIEARLAASAH